jgi:hypothetical protein
LADVLSQRHRESTIRMSGTLSELVSGSASGDEAPPVLGWSEEQALMGQTVFLTAPIPDLPPGSPVTFVVYETTGDPEEPIAELESAVATDGAARAIWQVRLDVRTAGEPRVVFEVELADDVLIAPALLVQDTLEAELAGPEGTVLAGAQVEVVDAFGVSHRAEADPEGMLRVVVPAGPCAMRRDGWKIEGERRPGDTALFTGELHAVRWERLPCALRFRAPRHGEVLVAGDAVRLDVEVRHTDPAHADAPPPPVDRWVASGPARIEQRGGTPWLILDGEPGEVSVYAESMGVGASATVQAVRPRLSRLQLVDHEGNMTPLYDHRSGRPALGDFTFDEAGRALRAHPGAMVFGTRLKVRVWLTFDRQPSRACQARLALVTDRMRDYRLPAPSDPALKDAPLTLLPASGDADAVFELGSAQEVGPFELLSDRELPACIRAHRLGVQVRVNVRHGDHGWCAPPDDPRAWLDLGRAYGVELFAMWGRPSVATGRPRKPGTEALKKNEVDPFHVRHAAIWADGGWNLRAAPPGTEDEGYAGSIPALVLSRLGHYATPDGYEGKDGLASAEHLPPENRDALPAAGIAPLAAERPDASRGRAVRTDRLVVRRRGEAAAVRLPVVTGGTLALTARLEAGHRGGPIRLRVTLDGEDRGATALLSATSDAARVVLGPVAPGAHVLELAPVDRGGAAASAWWARIDLETSPAPWTQRRRPADSWGFEVLDHATLPGGAPHQAASALASALAILGLPTRVALVRAREGGAVVHGTHDPLTRGTPGFDPKVDWGPNLTGFCVLEVDASRDTDPLLRGSAPLHEPHALALDPVAGRVAPAAMLGTSLHAQRRPVQGQLIRPECRCGHAWAPETWTDWPARVRTGAPVRLALAARVDAGPARWGRIAPGATYVLRYAAPGRWLVTGPERDAPADATATRMFLNPHRTPQRYTLDVWGRLLMFDATGAVRDPDAPELGVVGRLEAVGLPAFEAVEGLVWRMFPLELAAPFARRWHHERSFELPPLERVVRTKGKLRVAVSLTEPYAHYTVHIRVLLDGELKKELVIQPGASSPWIDLGDVKPGLRKLRVQMLAMGHGPMRGGLHGTVTVESAGKRPVPRRCVVCGAQPVWAYELSGGLDEPLVGAVVCPCPRCGSTVHDDDDDCWACALKLERRVFAPAAYAPSPTRDAGEAAS